MNFFAMKPGYLNCFWMNCTLSVLLCAVATMPSSFKAIITSELDRVLELRLQNRGGGNYVLYEVYCLFNKIAFHMCWQGSIGFIKCLTLLLSHSIGLIEILLLLYSLNPDISVS